MNRYYFEIANAKKKFVVLAKTLEEASHEFEKYAHQAGKVVGITVDNVAEVAETLPHGAVYEKRHVGTETVDDWDSSYQFEDIHNRLYRYTLEMQREVDHHEERGDRTYYLLETLNDTDRGFSITYARDGEEYLVAYFNNEQDAMKYWKEAVVNVNG